MTSAQPRTEFGSHIKFWRKKRGRTQLDLALMSGYSQRHLSFLESGRSQPSREAVAVLSDALTVPIRERNDLLRSAGHAPVYTDAGLSSELLRPSLDHMQELLNIHRPFPAILVDHAWNMHAANENSAALLAHFTHDATALQINETPNTIRYCLDPNGMRPYIVNFYEFMTGMQQQLIRAFDNAAMPAEYQSLMNEVQKALEDKPKTAAAVTLPPVLPLKLKRGDISLEFITLMSQFNFPTDANLAELKIETFIPANTETRAFLYELDRSLQK